MDIQCMEEAVTAWAAGHAGEPLRALLLGVTPEIAEMRWPERSSLTATDNSLPMVQARWPGDVPGRRSVVCGNWLAPPYRASSFDVAIGDGSINCLRFPGELRALAEVLCGLLRDDGILLLRSYVQSATRENPQEIYAASTGSINALKLRLFMAVQQSPQEGVALRDVYRSWKSRNLDREVLPLGAEWEKPGVAETIELYRDSNTVYAFPTLPELRCVLQEFFEEVSISIPGYDTGDRCPILLLKAHRNRPRPYGVG
jgi:hypothetical protein